MDSERPIEVAVVGGGCAAVATAFELTRPEHRGRYHVTLYQLGWRMGGKGASGRGPADRIEEHGLHIWMGFYENAFRLLRECYAERGDDPARYRFPKWNDAFYADPITGVVEGREGAPASHWLAFFPPGAGTPGDPGLPPRTFQASDYVTRGVQLLRSLLMSAPALPTGRITTAHARSGSDGSSPGSDLGRRIARVIELGQLATLAGAAEATRLLEESLAASGGAPSDGFGVLLRALHDGVRSAIGELVGEDVERRRIWQLTDLVLAILRGSMRHRLLIDPRGFDAIQDYDWREWLRENGASEESLSSAFLHSLYDLAFAYEDGDRRRPRAAASEALRCAVRAFLTYRGSFFWKMRAGMGDVVFAPFYEVLKRRGVTFRFFHRLENVRLSEPDPTDPDGRAHVEALEFDIQSEIVDGGEYEPIVDVDGLACWPSQPDFDQLVDGDRLRADGVDFESHWDTRAVGKRVLHVGEDFDFVVLGVGLGAIPFVCRQLVDRDPRWKKMVERVGTCATQAAQIWMNETVEELGWARPPINITGFDGYFETWADMRQLIEVERWPRPPRAIAYFCSALKTPDGIPDRSDRGHPAKVADEVRQQTIRFLDEEIGVLWPGCVADGRFRWDLLVQPDGENGPRDERRFDSQFWTANVNPTDRYTLCLPGSARYRISPLDDTYDNLTIAGDWTENGLNVGCVEAAVISGRLAAHAIAGMPALADIVGWDHP